MRRKILMFTLAPVFALALLMTGCSKSAEDAAAAEAAAAEAEVAAAEAKLAEAERAIAEAQAAEEKLAEAQKTLAAARRELDSAKRTSAAAKAKAQASPEGTSGWSQGAAPAAGAGAAKPAPPPPPKEYTVPAGSRIAVRTTSALTTKDHQAGHRFQATLTEPLEVDGYVIAPRGAAVTGEVSESDAGGRVKGVASIAVRLVSMETAGGETVAISTGAFGKDAPTSKKKDAAKVGIGAGVGAAIGAIAGGGRGAAIGAAAGGAAGTGAVMATRGDPAVIPSETVLTFTLNSPVTVTEKR
jgi:hypothetical protein